VPDEEGLAGPVSEAQGPPPFDPELAELQGERAQLTVRIRRAEQESESPDPVRAEQGRGRLERLQEELDEIDREIIEFRLQSLGLRNDETEGQLQGLNGLAGVQLALRGALEALELVNNAAPNGQPGSRIDLSA